MSGWIKCGDRMPLEVSGEVPFRSVEVIATDGVTVMQCTFDAGNGCGKPWAAWNGYNNIPASQITHWQPLPSPPTE